MLNEIAKLITTHQLAIEDFWLDNPMGKKHRKQIIKAVDRHNDRLRELAQEMVRELKKNEALRNIILTD